MEGIHSSLKSMRWEPCSSVAPATQMRYGMSDRMRIRGIERELQVEAIEELCNSSLRNSCAKEKEEDFLLHSAVNTMRNQACILRCKVDARRGSGTLGIVTRPPKKTKMGHRLSSLLPRGSVRFVNAFSEETISPQTAHARHAGRQEISSAAHATTGEFPTSPIAWVNEILARRVREVSAAVVPD